MEFSLEIEKPSNILHKLTIKVPSKEVKNHFDRKIAAIQRTAKLKGFRPGQVPLSLVKQYYGEDVRREVFKSLVDGSLEAAVAREKIRTVGTPQIETPHSEECKDESHDGHTHHHHHNSFHEDRDLTFTATVEVMPEIEIEDYTGVSLTRHKVEVTDKQVENVVNQLCQMRAVVSPLAEARPVQTGDYVEAEIKGKIASAEGWTERADMSGKRVIEIGASSWIPGFEENIMGLSTGDTKTFKLFFPKDFGDAEMAEKEAEFTVTVNSIKEKKLPTLDDDLAKELGYESVADMSKRAREYLEGEVAQESTKRLESDLLSSLIKKTQFDIPAGLIENQTHSLVQEWVRDLQGKGVGQAAIEKAIADEFPQIKSHAETQLRASLILETIAGKENLSVSSQEIDAEIVNIVAYAPAKDKQDLKEFYTKGSGRMNLRFKLRQQKTVEFLLGKADITEKLTAANE